jgi:uncharacterized protein YcgI (DUF1989 family)
MSAKRSNSQFTEEITVSPGEACAVFLAEGDSVLVTDPIGMQIGDAVFISAAEPVERFSQAATRLVHETVLGDHIKTLIGNRGNVMATITRDDVTNNDIVSPACHPERYVIDWNAPTHASCHGSLVMALAKLGIPEDMVPDPFNLFMRTIPWHGWLPIIEESLAQSGSSIEFRAEMDLYFATSSCPQDFFSANGYEITPLELTVIRSAD